MAHATPVASDIADLKWGDCKGRSVTLRHTTPKDYPGALRTGGFTRSAGRPQEGRAQGASGAIFGQTQGEERYRNSVRTGVLQAPRVRDARNRSCRNQLSTLKSW
jgi:hypothetical protein